MRTVFAANITHTDIARFAEDKVNLKREHARKYRDQVQNVRDHIERYIKDNPDTGLVKTLLSGSLAKSTALSKIRDVDVALYVKADTAPSDQGKLLEWIVSEFRKTYPNKTPDDIYIDGPCVVISFSGTGLDVDIVPVYYDGDPDDKGFIWDRFTGEKILTSIPMHLNFILKRKNEQQGSFAQIVRLVKWWSLQKEKTVSGFHLRSFLIELIMAHLADSGKDFSNYIEIFKQFFLYLTSSELSQRIAFTDYYSKSELPEITGDAIEIFDPVTPNNNVASNYSEQNRQTIVRAAEDDFDALIYAQRATTKTEAVECWQEILGTSFR